MGKGHIFRIVCGAMIAIIVVILVALFVSDDNKNQTVNVNLDVPYSDTNTWMSYLSDDSYISEITIPGTHNSCARYVSLDYMNRCQSTSITQQLEDGYRFLELKVAIDENEEGNRIKLVNGSANCHKSGKLFSGYLYFEDVCDEIFKFLQQYSTETVIVNVKIDDKEHSVSDVEKMLKDILDTNKDYWYTEDEIPTLGEVRGKAVLALGFPDKARLGLAGINTVWKDQSNKVPADIPYELYVYDNYRLWVQDRYNYSVEDKYEAVVDGLENCEADDRTLFFNYVSTTGDGKIGHPQGYANELNDLLLKYDLKDETSYGIVIVDFGNIDLARHFYYTNLS
ncbi:MAG: phosphatidylinositol-specific phospholipase C domain-containing protein [Pseudobutyrivibrio sp.]|nr:phosphatidylinositol-specific phospholipase C domain-containing protein [Pseudobutyrivibrio sp.]